jgi:TolB-like protein/Tfp pilus assembly protein PilF
MRSPADEPIVRDAIERPSGIEPRMSLFAELKRRNVLRAATLYAAAAWLLVQVATQVFPFFDIPNWIVRWIVIAAAIGFPFAMLLSWFYELTPEGFKRESEVEVSESIRYSTGRKLDFWIIGVLTVAVVLLLANTFVLHRDANTPTISQAPGKSIAVLPFENLSDDKGNAYFASGMQDMILTKLSTIGALKVIARTSTEKYKSRPGDLKSVAQELGVATILEGSVQKSANQVLISVRLIDAATDNQLWAEAYPRTLDNIFGVEGEVAQKVAEALNAKLTTAETERVADKPTQNPVAFDLFLQAEALANRGSINQAPAHLKPAIDLYRKAVAADPNFALAWARLSYAESLLAWFGGSDIDVPTLNNSAHADAEHALSLQPELADAQLALAACDYYGHGDYAGAMVAYNAVLRTRPSDAGALADSAYVLRRQGQFDEAIGRLQAALVHDPRNTIIAANLGLTYAMTSRYADAERNLDLALALDPGNNLAKIGLSKTIVLASGDIDRAIAQAQGDSPELRVERAELLALQRKYVDAIALLEPVPDKPDTFNFSDRISKSLLLANLYRVSGNSANAQPLFVKARAELDRILLARTSVPIRQAIVWVAIADAELGLGHADAALQALVRSRQLVAESGDHSGGAFVVLASAQLYAQAGHADLAVAKLQELLSSPGGGWMYSPRMLRIDPRLDPIRNDPRFQKLVADTEAAQAKTKP